MPIMMFLHQGQVSVIPLLGLLGFLYWTGNRRNDYLSGASFALATFKPHLVLLLGLVFLFWILYQRRWKVFLGFCFGLLIPTLLVLLDNPLVFIQFFQEYSTGNYLRWLTPTIGTGLRYLFGGKNYWLQFIPLLIGFSWTLYFWRKKKNDWNWLRDVQPVLWASFLTATYTMSYDEILLLIPILATLVSLAKSGWSGPNLLWLGILVTLNLAASVLHLYIPDHFFIWFVPVLFLWDWLAKKYQKKGIYTLEGYNGELEYSHP